MKLFNETLTKTDICLLAEDSNYLTNITLSQNFLSNS